MVRGLSGTQKIPNDLQLPSGHLRGLALIHDFLAIDPTGSLSGQHQHDWDCGWTLPVDRDRSATHTSSEREGEPHLRRLQFHWIWSIINRSVRRVNSRLFPGQSPRLSTTLPDLRAGGNTAASSLS